MSFGTCVHTCKCISTRIKYVAVYVPLFVFLSTSQSKIYFPLLVSRVRQRRRPSKATCPFFTWLQHITSFPPGTDAPLPAGLTDLTSRPNLQNSPPSLFPALYPHRSPPSIRLGQSVDRWPLRTGSAVRVRSVFWNFFGGTVRRWTERWTDGSGLKLKILGKRKMSEELVEGRENRREEWKNCQSVQTVPPVIPSFPRRPPHPYFHHLRLHRPRSARVVCCQYNQLGTAVYSSTCWYGC